MSLLLHPGFWLAALLWTLAAVGGGYWWGDSAADNACSADAATASSDTEAAEDARDTNIEAIGADADTAAAAAHNDTRGAADESAARIRTVYVPADCRPVPAGVLRELAAARERVNAKVRGGVRPSPADAAPADSAD